MGAGGVRSAPGGGGALKAGRGGGGGLKHGPTGPEQTKEQTQRLLTRPDEEDAGTRGITPGSVSAPSPPRPVHLTGLATAGERATQTARRRSTEHDAV